MRFCFALFVVRLQWGKAMSFSSLDLTSVSEWTQFPVSFFFKLALLRRFFVAEINWTDLRWKLPVNEWYNARRYHCYTKHSAVRDWNQWQYLQGSCLFSKDLRKFFHKKPLQFYRCFSFSMKADPLRLWATGPRKATERCPLHCKWKWICIFSSTGWTDLPSFALHDSEVMAESLKHCMTAFSENEAHLVCPTRGLFWQEQEQTGKVPNSLRRQKCGRRESSFKQKCPDNCSWPTSDVRYFVVVCEFSKG